MTDIFFPIIKKIFSITEQTLLQKREEEIVKQIQLQNARAKQDVNKKKRRANNRKRKAKATPQKQSARDASSKENVETDPVIQVASVAKAAEGSRIVPPPAPMSIAQPPTAIPELRAQAIIPPVIESVLVVPKISVPQIPLTDTTNSLESLALDDSEAYDPEPWEKYKKSNDSTHGSFPQQCEEEQSRNLSPHFVLSDENSMTAKILLGLGKNMALEKVTMLEYIKLVQELGGSVINSQKGVHFMARSLRTQEWCAVAMHRLHQDDPNIIPRNTRYWKIAKQLLLDIELSEVNLKL